MSPTLPDTSNYSGLLKSITSNARQLLNVVANTSSHPLESARSESRSSALPSPLAEPRPIVTLLCAQGINPAAAEKISATYFHQAQKLKEVFEERIHREVETWSLAYDGDDLQTHIGSLRGLFSSLYDATLRQWVDLSITRYRQRVDVALLAQVQGPEDKGGATKQDASSVLETAFKTNRYPRRSAKEELASKTGMSLRQINVWFQNKRNRTKKDNPPPKKTHLMDNITIMYPPVTPDVASTEGMDAGCSVTNGSRDIRESARKPDVPFISTAPSHAFPAAYPPECDYDPFPGVGARTFETTWPRQPTPCTSPKPSESADVDGLTTWFASLEIDTISIPPTPTPRPSAVGFNLLPLKAPLPALIRETVTVRTVKDSNSQRSIFTPQPRVHPLPQRERSRASPRRNSRIVYKLARDPFRPYPPSGQTTGETTPPGSRSSSLSSDTSTCPPVTPCSSRTSSSASSSPCTVQFVYFKHSGDSPLSPSPSR